MDSTDKVSSNYNPNSIALDKLTQKVYEEDNQKRALGELQCKISAIKKAIENLGDDFALMDAETELSEITQHGINLPYYDKRSIAKIRELIDSYVRYLEVVDPEAELSSPDIICKKTGFTKTEMENLYALDEYLKKYKLSINFREQDRDERYSLKQALVAYKKVNSFSEKVKSQKQLSVVEKLALCYSYVAGREYIKDETTAGKTRDLISVLNNKEIVCVGYAKIFQNLCSKLGVRCDIVTLRVVDAKTGNVCYHASCRAYVNDPKYKVKGYFDFDPTFDSRKSEQIEKNLSNTFAFFMMPIGDYANSFNRHYSYQNKADAVLENKPCYENFAVGGKFVSIDNKSDRNMGLSLLGSIEKEEIQKNYFIPGNIFVKMDNDATKKKVEELLKTKGKAVVDGIRKSFKGAVKYTIPRSVLEKAIAYEIVEVDNSLNETTKAQLAERLALAKKDFYKNLNKFKFACEIAGVEPNSTTAELKDEVTNILENISKTYNLFGAKYGRILDEQQLLCFMQKQREECKTQLSFSDMRQVIDTILPLTKRKSTTDDVLFGSVKKALQNYFGHGAMVSSEALKFGAGHEKDLTAQTRLLSAIFGSDVNER